LEIELIAPEIAVLVTALAVIIADLFLQEKKWLTLISLIGLFFAGCYVALMWNGDAQLTFYNMLSVDNYALFFKMLFLSIAALVIGASYHYTDKFPNYRGEYHALILLATLGMMLMAAAVDLISLYLSLELAAISLYALTGFLKDKKSTESSLKFLLIGGVASAVLIYGMALIFGTTGETQLGAIASSIAGIEAVTENPALLMGIVMLIAGFGFKIAAVPFQFWVPDVYEGAPTPVTMFLSVGSKAAGFAILIRVFTASFTGVEVLSTEWALIIAVISAIGMTLGNIAAIAQKNIKRLLAYSSIAHAGYLMIGVAAIGMSQGVDLDAQGSTLFYLIAFVFTDLAAFTAIIGISRFLNSDNIKDYSGLGKRSPWLASALTLALLSLTGFPPTAGFLAKFYIFSAGINNGLLWLVVIAAVNTVISAYFYLNVIKVMWMEEPSPESAKIQAVKASAVFDLSLAIPSALILVFGIIPALAIEITEMAARIFIY
jgi:NADH-quinone oxidoreductase subunit N